MTDKYKEAYDALKHIDNLKARFSFVDQNTKDTIYKALQLAHDNRWRDIESAPIEENVSYLVYVPKKHEDEYSCVVQVSNFEGNMYPDSMQHSVDWSDQVIGATHWKPLDKPEVW